MNLAEKQIECNNLCIRSMSRYVAQKSLKTWSKWSATGPAANRARLASCCRRTLEATPRGEANNRVRMAKTDIANPIERHVGRRLRMRRLALGMSQQSLAEAIGVTFRQVVNGLASGWGVRGVW